MIGIPCRRCYGLSAGGAALIGPCIERRGCRDEGCSQAGPGGSARPQLPAQQPRQHCSGGLGSRKIR